MFSFTVISETVYSMLSSHLQCMRDDKLIEVPEKTFNKNMDEFMFLSFSRKQL